MVYFTNYIFAGSILTHRNEGTEAELRRHVLDFFKPIQFTKDGFISRAHNDSMRMTLSVGKLFEPHHQGHNYSLDHKTFSVIIL